MIAPKQMRTTMPSMACRTVVLSKPFHIVFRGSGLKPGCKTRRVKKLCYFSTGSDGKKLPDLGDIESVKEEYRFLSNIWFFLLMLEASDTHHIAHLCRQVDVYYLVREYD